MKTVFTATLLLFFTTSYAKGDIYVSATGDTLREGDSIKFIENKPLDGVVIDYIRKDNFYAMHMAFIDRMPGRTFEVDKIRGGIAYLKIKEVRMNDWSFLKYKLYLTKLLESGSVMLVKSK